jgi:RNA polymerase sigma-70 factor (ECF subfamily)
VKEFQEQYRDLKGSFMRYANSLLKDEARAEDVVHEAFLSAFSNWDSFHGKSKRSTWMWAILRNECLQHFRKAELRHEKLGEEELATLPTTDDSADVQLIKASEATFVQSALDSLSPKQREILELRLAEVSLEEISDLLAIPTSTVKSHIHRAKKELIRYMKENQNEKR